MRKTMLVKASGDVCASDTFLNFIQQKAVGYFIVIVVGGGTQISERLNSAGYTENKGWKFGHLGRELIDFKARQIARDVLEENQAELQDLLADKEINATVTIPVLDISSVLCHVNGDQMLLTHTLGLIDLSSLPLQNEPPKREPSLSSFRRLKWSDYSPLTHSRRRNAPPPKAPLFI